MTFTMIIYAQKPIKSPQILPNVSGGWGFRPHHHVAQQNASFIVPTVCKYYVESGYIKHVD